jgi:hypothetical protein
VNSTLRNKLEEYFAKYPTLRGEGVSDTDIDEASRLIHRPIPLTYRDFLRMYGAAVVGPYPIFGLQRVAAMGNSSWSVVDMNADKSRRWPGTEGWLIISEDLAGNPIGLDSDERVLIADFELGTGVGEYAKDFESFLVRALGGM